MAKRGVVGNRLDFIEPMQPTLVGEPPRGEDWVHELKLDGYRSHVVLEAGKARVFTWRGHDGTDKYWPIAAEALACRSAIIDGEMIGSMRSVASPFASFARRSCEHRPGWRSSPSISCTSTVRISATGRRPRELRR